jgi:hypothetical protein
MNGEQGNGLIDDKVRWQREVFTPAVNTLIADILQLGGDAELMRIFTQFRKEFEPALQQTRDRLMSVAMDRGLET